jgi:hypothetical protein
VRLVDLVDGERADGPDGWPVAVLYRPGAPLTAAIDVRAAELGVTGHRIAASSLFIGHAVRLWCVTLGCWERDGVVPNLTADAVRVPAPGLDRPLRLTGPGGWRPADPDDLATVATLTTPMVIEPTRVRSRRRCAPRRASRPACSGATWPRRSSAPSARLPATPSPPRPARRLPTLDPARDHPGLAAVLLAAPPFAPRKINYR